LYINTHKHFYIFRTQHILPSIKASYVNRRLYKFYFAVYLMLQLNALQHILWRLCMKRQSRKRLLLLCY